MTGKQYKMLTQHQRRCMVRILASDKPTKYHALNEATLAFADLKDIETALRWRGWFGKISHADTEHPLYIIRDRLFACP